MPNAENCCQSSAGTRSHSFGRLHHGCRRPRFWLITGLRRSPLFPNYRASHGRSKEEDFAIAPQYAAVAPRAEAVGLCRMPELRRVEASTPPVRFLRIL